MSAADLGLQLVNLPSKSIGRKPFGHRVGVKKRSIDSLRCRTENAMKLDRVG